MPRQRGAVGEPAVIVWHGSTIRRAEAGAGAGRGAQGRGSGRSLQPRQSL
jgi:hypothetical protein